MKTNIQLLFMALALILSITSCKEEHKGTKTFKSAVTLKPEKPAADFERVVYKVLKAFADKDQVIIDSLTSVDAGVIILYRTGVFNEYKRISNLSFAHPVPETFKYPEPKRESC